MVWFFDGDLFIDEIIWGDGYVVIMWGCCFDMMGVFVVIVEFMKGVVNVCDGEVEVGVWLGLVDVRVFDSVFMFFEDSLGLDV